METTADAMEPPRACVRDVEGDRGYVPLGAGVLVGPDFEVHAPSEY